MSCAKCIYIIKIEITFIIIWNFCVRGRWVSTISIVIHAKSDLGPEHLYGPNYFSGLTTYVEAIQPEQEAPHK